MKWYSLFTKMLGKSKEQQLKQRILKDTARVDFSSVTHDWEKAKLLFDAMKGRCHPDLFGDDLKDEATEIFQLLMQNKYNYEQLLEIKKLANEKLHINF